MLTLIEKAQSAFSEEEALEMQKKMRTNSFTLEDYLAQMEKMKSMGDMSQMISMIPGLAGKLGGKNVDIDEAKIAKSKAIIQSMTIKERRNPELIKSSQKKRIAMGSGTNVQDINSLLKQFSQTQEMMQKMSNMGKRGMRGMKFPF